MKIKSPLLWRGLGEVNKKSPALMAQGLKRNLFND